MLYCFIGCLLIKISLQINNLMFNLEPNEQHCLEEYFSDRTLIIYEIFSSTKIFDVRILDPEGKSISEKLDETSFKHAFTSFIGGYYQSCILNKSKEVAEINFTIRHGVAAKDYSSVAKTKDLKPLELDVSLSY